MPPQGQYVFNEIMGTSPPDLLLMAPVLSHSHAKLQAHIRLFLPPVTLGPQLAQGLHHFPRNSTKTHSSFQQICKRSRVRHNDEQRPSPCLTEPQSSKFPTWSPCLLTFLPFAHSTMSDQALGNKKPSMTVLMPTGKKLNLHHSTPT